MTETTKRTTKVWAHRGASGYRPENTLEAFELAIRQGADGIEMDVHTSADGELIVMHDENVDRVTDGTGLIKDMTLAQLKELKVSTPAEPSGIYHIPTLAEVLELMRTTDMMVNIELKNSICFYPGMEGKILKLVKEMNMEDQLIYSSFNHYSLLQLKQLNDHVQTGILFSDGWVNPAMYAKNLGINAVHPAVYHLKYPQFIEEVKEQYKLWSQECKKCPYETQCASCSAIPYETDNVQEYINKKTQCGFTHAVVAARLYFKYRLLAKENNQNDN